MGGRLFKQMVFKAPERWDVMTLVIAWFNLRSPPGNSSIVFRVLSVLCGSDNKCLWTPMLCCHSVKTYEGHLGQDHSPSLWRVWLLPGQMMDSHGKPSEAACNDTQLTASQGGRLLTSKCRRQLVLWKFSRGMDEYTKIQCGCFLTNLD